MNNPNPSAHISRAAFTFVLMAFALVALFTLSSQQAFASQQLVEKYQDLAKSKGMSFTYGSLEEQGSGSFRLNDVTLILAGVEDPVKIKSISLTGVNELNGIGLSADNFNLVGLSWDGQTSRGQEIIVSLSNANLDGFYFADPADPDAPLVVFDRIAFNANNLDVSIDGTNVITVPAMSSKFLGTQERKQFDGDMQIPHITVNPDAIPDGGKLKQQLSLLGYSDLDLSANVEMGMNFETGDAQIRQYEIAAADMGAIDLQVNFSGYTTEFTKKIRTINAEIQALPADQRAIASQKLMAEFANLTLSSMKLSFHDDSITDKIVGFQARAMGQPVDNMKAMLPTMLSGVLAGLQKPELAAKIVGAVEQFLASPGAIAVSATPDAPVTFGELVGMAMSMPALLIDQLKLDVQAN